MHIAHCNMHIARCNMHIACCNMHIACRNKHIVRCNIHIEHRNMHIVCRNMHIACCDIHIAILKKRVKQKSVFLDLSSSLSTDKQTGAHPDFRKLLLVRRLIGTLSLKCPKNRWRAHKTATDKSMHWQGWKRQDVFAKSQYPLVKDLWKNAALVTQKACRTRKGCKKKKRG